MVLSMRFDMLIGASGSHRSLLPVTRGIIPFGREGLASQVPEGCFYLTGRNPSLDQIEPISGYLDCLLEFEELGFPLTVWGCFVCFV